MNEVWTPAALWLLQISVVASILILLTLLLARFTRQPARRQRLCEAGLAAALLATALSLAPAWLVIAVPVGAKETTKAEPDLALVELLDLRPNPEMLVPDQGPAAIPAPIAETDSPTAPADSPGISLRAAVPLLLLALYGGGTVFFLLRWLGGWLMLRRLLRNTEPAPAQMFAMLGIAQNSGPRLLLSRKLRVPISCGVWRPTVVLPIDFCRPDHTALRWVFAHELTHIERKDALSAVLFALGQVVFFHLPWFWMLRKQVRLCQEYVADAAAVAERPADEYAEFLLTLTENKALSLLTTGVGGPVSDLFRRVTMLLQNPLRVEKRCPRLWTWGLAGVLLAVATMLGGVGLRAAAADTIIIIIPGKQAAEPGKDKTADAKKTAPENILRFTDQARKAGIIFKLDDQGNIQAANPLLDPAIRDRLATVVADPNAAPAKKPPQLPGDLDRLNQILQDLEMLQRTRPDAKELRDLIERLKYWKAKTSSTSKEKLEGLYAQGVLPKGLAFSPDGKALLWSDGKDPNIRIWDSGTGKQLQVVDWKKLEQLLERLQKAPGKVDPKEISKALEEIRKATSGVRYWVQTQPNVNSFDAWRSLVSPPGAKGRFGIRFSPPSNDLREHLGLPKGQGLVIEDVDVGSPAAKAGLKAKDIVLKLDDQPVSSDTNKASQMFGAVKDGTSVDLTILRRGKEEVIKGIKPAGPDWQWIRSTVRERHIADLDKVPEKGALVTMRSDGGAFSVQQREEQLTITIKGALKDGKATNLEILIQVEGKEAYKGAPAGVPEAWRSRVMRLMDLIRSWQTGQTGAPAPRFHDPLPKGGSADLPANPNRPNPPPISVKGRIEKVDPKDGLVEISIGGDQGLKKDHTLEVFRLSPKAEYLGTLRVVEVYHHKAVGRMIQNTFANRQKVQQGDQVAGSLEQP